jgi:hypothetical protein
MIFQVIYEKCEQANDNEAVFIIGPTTELPTLNLVNADIQYTSCGFVCFVSEINID